MPLIGSRRILEESRGGCKPDLKTEAQRTNRFNTNSSHNSASSCLTPCNHIESITGVGNDYKTQEKDDVPCINIILKPISDTKTDQKDKGIQIVEVTAVTENNNNHSINNANTPLPDQCQSSSKETEKVETKSVKVQTKVVKNIHDSSTQTTETPTDQKKFDIPTNEEQTTAEATIRNSTVCQQAPDADKNKRNRGVQFRDDKTVANNGNCSNRTLSTGVDPDTKSYPEDNSSCDKNAVGIVDNKFVKTTGQETSTSPLECSEPMETLYTSVNNEDTSNRSSEFKSCVKKGGQETQGRLSDRIKHNIDKMEIGNYISMQSSATNTSHGTQHESIETETKILRCTDLCKDIISRAGWLKTYSEKINNSVATQDTSTLASVLSNNPPIPRISIDTTESAEWESPSKNKSSKVTIGTTVTDSRFFSSLDNMTCCSSRKLSNEGISYQTPKVSSNEEEHKNESCKQQYSDDERIKVCGNSEKKDTTESNVQKFNTGTGTRGSWSNETTTLSKLGIVADSSVRTNSTNTPNEVNTLGSTRGLPLIRNDKSAKENTFSPGNRCRSTAVQTNSVSFSQNPERLEAKPDSALSRPNTRPSLTALDLTRPEFIRMLTEIKEHTCSLELQLSAMNDAMKRKQATRSKVLSSTLKDYEPMRQDNFGYKTQNKKIKTANDSSCCASDFSSPIEYARRISGESNIENLMDTSYGAPPDRHSLSANRYPGNKTPNDETCCGSTITSEPNESYSPLKSPRKLKTSLHSIRSAKPEQISLVPDESSISITKHRRKTPAFKTKRSYLWAPLRNSDYRIWKHKLHKLTPSMKSMIMPEILPQSKSPTVSMVRSKIDVSCSSTNCCDLPEDSLQTMFKAGGLSPIRKLEKSNATVRSANRSSTSNTSVNRRIVRPAFLSSTLKRNVKMSPSAKYKAVTQAKNNTDQEINKPIESKAVSTTMVSCCDFDTSKYSNEEKNSSQNTKIEPVLEMMEQSREHLVPTSPFKLKRPKVRPRLGIKQSSFKFRTKGRPQSIPSNSHLYSSVSRESFYDSSSNISSKNRKTEDPAVKPFQLKKLGVVPRLKLRSINSRNSSLSYAEKNNSRALLDPSCCSTENGNDNEEAISGVTISSHSNRHQSVPAEEILTTLLDRKRGKNHFAYAIATEQSTPFSSNNFSKYDSEEEVNSTDYGFNKSGQEYCGKETKDSMNGKKRKGNSGAKKFIKTEQKSDFGKSRNNSKLSKYQEYSGNNSKSKKNSQQSMSSDRYSGKVQEFNDVYNHRTNSIENDSKCTIRVTVSLDNTLSNEEVKKI